MWIIFKIKIVGIRVIPYSIQLHKYSVISNGNYKIVIEIISELINIENPLTPIDLSLPVITQCSLSINTKIGLERLVLNKKWTDETTKWT